jgi:hypothetical protein
MPRFPTTPFTDGALLEAFEPLVRDTDVFVAAASKVGQTWVLALLHHLRTEGRDPDFGGRGAMAVTPWLEIPRDMMTGKPHDRVARLAELEALPDPRVFKMHVVWEEIPRQGRGKVITITRDPRDVPWSMYQHLVGLQPHLHAAEWKDPGFDTWFDGWIESTPYFPIVRSFWAHRNDPDLLWLRYEDLKVDLRRGARQCVDFLGWSVSAEGIERAVALSDLSAMQRHEASLKMGAWREGHRFVREGAVGKNRARLSAEQQQRVVQRARATLEPECVDFVMTQGA